MKQMKQKCLVNAGGAEEAIGYYSVGSDGKEVNYKPPVSATATNLQFLDGAFVVDFPIEVLYSFYETLQLGFMPLHCTANLLLDQTLHLQTTMATFKENESPRTWQCWVFNLEGKIVI